MNESEFEYNLNKDVAIIIASMKEQNKEINEHQKEDEYILIDNPINRISETKY